MIQSSQPADELVVGLSSLTNTNDNYLNVGFYDIPSGYFSIPLQTSPKGNAVSSSDGIIPRILYEKIQLANDHDKAYKPKSAQTDIFYIVLISFNHLSGYNKFKLMFSLKSGGSVSQVNEHSVTINPSANSSDNLQISLNWAYPVDMDLHVQTPDGNDIYYGSPVGQNGGMLDLDSNPTCIIDNVNNENITWGNNLPASGTYILRADLWSACNFHDSIPFILTLNKKGLTTTYSGKFSPPDQSYGGALSGRIIASFDFNK
jgi:hypothetical protein